MADSVSQKKCKKGLDVDETRYLQYFRTPFNRINSKFKNSKWRIQHGGPKRRKWLLKNLRGLITDLHKLKIEKFKMADQNPKTDLIRIRILNYVKWNLKFNSKWWTKSELIWMKIGSWGNLSLIITNVNFKFSHSKCRIRYGVRMRKVSRWRFSR